MFGIFKKKFKLSIMLHMANGTTTTIHYNTDIQPQIGNKLLTMGKQFLIINVSIVMDRPNQLITNAKEIVKDDKGDDKKDNSSGYNRPDRTTKRTNRVITTKRLSSVSES